MDTRKNWCTMLLPRKIHNVKFLGCLTNPKQSILWSLMLMRIGYISLDVNLQVQLHHLLFLDRESTCDHKGRFQTQEHSFKKRKK